MTRSNFHEHSESLPSSSHTVAEPLRLHVGGWEAKPGWKILNIQKRPGVDYVGNCAA